MSDTLIQFGPFALWIAISVPPAFAICKRIGKSRWWSAICVLPVAGPIIFLFIMAYSKWRVQATYNLSVADPEKFSTAAR